MRFYMSMLAGLAALGLMAAPTMAQQLTNPWSGDGAEVKITIDVPAIGEVWSSIGSGQARNNNPNVVLQITNAGGFIPAAGIAEDTVYANSNVNYEVSVELDGDIPAWTRFHVLVGVQNRGAYNSVFAGLPGQTDVDAATVITFDRRDTGFVGANTPGNAIPAFTGVAGSSATPTLVDYAADAIHGMPAISDMDIELIWTIAQQ
jgi:hypothetical protein